MELTWTDVVFSRIALVLFLCRNQSSPNVVKIYGSSFGKYQKYLRQVRPQGVGQWATSPCSATTPLVAVEGLWDPQAPAAPNSSSISCLSSQEKKRSFRRVFDTEAPPPPVLHLEGRSEVRLGLRRGEIVAIIIINLLPSAIP